MLELSRQQILGHRLRASALIERLPRSARSLESAAKAGLQDSMPRAALLSIHARVESATPQIWEEPPLVQVWGPRFSAYVIARDDLAIFTLGRLPIAPKARRRAEETADLLEQALGGERMDVRDAAAVAGTNPNALRYAAPTGRFLIYWDGARQPFIWSVEPPAVDPLEARKELARRHLHIFGPATPGSLAGWAGARPRDAIDTFDSLREELVRVETPIGEGWILATDESSFRSSAEAGGGTRLLPSGDTYYLLQGDDRDLLVPEASRRDELWTSRVWPGAVLVDGEVVGTWRRSRHQVTIDLWDPARADRERIEAEAASLPLPALTSPVSVTWE